MEINQFHSGAAVGDAITNQMLLIQKLLIKNGYKSNIYVEYVPKELSEQLKPIDSYSGNKDAILFVHHSMGMNCFDKIVNLPDKKALIYHNITPERFFEDEGLKKYIRLGLQQAKDYRDYLDYYIADSNYNRQELIRMGYPSEIDILPVSISLDRFEKTCENKEIVNKYIDKKNILFVGRVVPNKCQEDIIKAFAVYHKYYNKESNLFIIGDTGMQNYVQNLENLIDRYEIKDAVVMPGKVSEEDLKAYYMSASVFLCMSEHEGFGVPLLEAMKMHVPVVAYRSSAIAETMDHAGVIVTEKNYAYLGALIDEVITNAELNQAIVECQNKRIEKMEHLQTEEILNSVIEKMQNGTRKKTIQLQGPFETSYSLALVNRKLMEKMDDLDIADISIYCSEGPGDYEPKKEDLAKIPHATRLWEKSKDESYPDVVIRNMYPPRVNDVNGGLNFFAFGWEESVIPAQYIKNFNTYLSGIGTMSDYVTQKLIECGITIPVRTMGIGVDLVDDFESLAPYKLKTIKKIKFLHISSAFPRKGVDALLKGYYEAFTGNDDVCLILKTFPNPHNTVKEIIDDLNSEYSNPPEIEWINHDLSNSELCSLYKAANCYVQVARGEGFGLPVAEAMLAKLPVIVSPNTGMADFCNEETAFLVGYDFEPAHTHVSTHDGAVSMWAEPRVEELVTRLKEFYENPESRDVWEKVEKAYRTIHDEFSWESVANRWNQFIKDVEAEQFKPRVAMVTTWNSKCGIAEYTKMEVDNSKYYVDYQIYPNYGVELLSRDEKYVQRRLWHSAFEGDMHALVDALLNSNNQIVHFQFNFGFYKLKDLGEAIEQLAPLKKVVITFHKTADSDVGGKVVSLKSIVPALNKCAALVVHQQSDEVYLKSIGIEEKRIFVINHGQVTYPEISSEYAKKKIGIKNSLVIGSYGFLLPHKGIKEVIQALPVIKKDVPDILYMPVCALHDSQISKDYYKECMEEVQKLELNDNVRFITDFLENDESMKYLQACDALVMPYKPSKESASGAIRFCLAALRPIITTEQPIFDEFKDCTMQIEKTDPDLIVEAICKSVNDTNLVKDMKTYIDKTSWYNTGKKFYDLYTEI